MRVPVGIVGFRGYSGAELVSILQRHPHVEPLLMEHRSDAGDRQSLAARRARSEFRRLRMRRDPRSWPSCFSLPLRKSRWSWRPRCSSRSEGDRPQRGVPAAHRRALHALVQSRAHAAGAAGRSRLRAAGILPRADSRRAADRQSRAAIRRRRTWRSGR